MDATVTPLPTEETTPPVQKRYFVTLTSLSGFHESVSEKRLGLDFRGLEIRIFRHDEIALAILSDNGLFVHCLQLYNPTLFCYNSAQDRSLP
jgi:hypothetical protein